MSLRIAFGASPTSPSQTSASRQRPSITLAETAEHDDERAANILAALSRTCNRFYIILEDREAQVLEALGHNEWSLLSDAMDGAIYEPAASIAWLPDDIDEAIDLEGLDEKYGVNGPVLVAKLRKMSLADKVLVVEVVENWWRIQRHAS